MLTTQLLAPRASPSPSSQDLDILAAQLREAAEARLTQLEALPHDTTLVAAAHRASVARILHSILAAQARLAAGTFGVCSSCAHGIDARSLHCRPWTDLCDRCIRR